MNRKPIARLLILLAFVVTVLALLKARDLKFDYHFESFFPSNDPELEFFESFKKTFGNDNDYILIGIESKASIFDSTFLQELESLTEQASQLPHVRNVISPTRLSQPVFGPFGPIQIPFVHPSSPELYASDSARIYSNRHLTAPFFSADASSVNLLIQTVAEPSKSKSDSLVHAINSMMEDFNFEAVHIAGKVPAQFEYIKRMKRELAVFISLAVVLLSIVLSMMFRSVWAVLIPLLIVFASIIWLLGFMGLTGKSIDLMMTLMPTMLFVVGMSDAIHFLSRYRELLKRGTDKWHAIKTTVREVGLATFLTSLTTAFGFLSLMSSSIKPVQEFGLYIGIGVGFAFIITFLLLPAVSLLTTVPVERLKEDDSKKWHQFLSATMLFTFKQKRLILILAGLFLVAGIAGMTQIEVNTYLLEDLSEDDKLKRDFTFFEEEFDGVRPMEIVQTIEAGTGSVWDRQSVLQSEFVSIFIGRHYGTGEVNSTASIVKSFNQAMHGGSPEFYSIPAEGQPYEKVKRQILRYKKTAQIKQFASLDEKNSRISARMPDLGSRIIRMKDQSFYEVLPAFVDTSNTEFRITGTARLIDKNISYLSVNMIQGLLGAFLLIALIAGFMFKSLRMVVIALLPNLLPLVVVAGVMGFLGLDLKVSTSIIFTIAFGIAVDDTIHFLARFRMEVAAGRSIPWALRRTYHITGKAIMLTTLVLITGFITLIFSSFQGTSMVGLLVSLTLLLAVIFDLLMLPLLLLMYRIR